MADRKKGRKRKDEYPDPDEKPDKPTKDEYTIATWLRNNVPTKKTKFLNHNVQYFTGSKAVDALMASKFGTPAKEGEEPFFSSRDHCVSFLDDMLRHKFFHRAKKVPISEEFLKLKKKKDKVEEKKDKGEAKEKKEEEQTAESSHAEGKGQEQSETDDGRKKKKKKIRLEMHLQQFFADNLDAYVWIYDPIPAHYWFFGFLVVLAGIGICLFPLWPPSVRMFVYYLSMAAAGFLVFIIVLAILRSVIFCTIWLLTLSKHHFWIFPNLTEDVGFFASFWPLYEYKYVGDEVSTNKKKKKKKEKLSDNEDEDAEKEILEEKETLLQTEAAGEGSGSESEHSSQQSQTGKDFEIVDHDEVEAH